jgi:hypothetical protein
MLRHYYTIVFVQIKHSVFDCKVRNQKRFDKVGLFRTDTVNIRPRQFMAWVKAFEQFLETTPCLTASGSVSVVAIETFAGFDVIDKLIEEIPDIRAGSFLFFSLNPFGIGFFLFFFLPSIFPDATRRSYIRGH